MGQQLLRPQQPLQQLPRPQQPLQQLLRPQQPLQPLLRPQQPLQQLLRPQQPLHQLRNPFSRRTQPPPPPPPQQQQRLRLTAMPACAKTMEATVELNLPHSPSLLFYSLPSLLVLCRLCIITSLKYTYNW